MQASFCGEHAICRDVYGVDWMFRCVCEEGYTGAQVLNAPTKCKISVCKGEVLSVPQDMVRVEGTTLPATVITGDKIGEHVGPQKGYVCSGSEARAFCAADGATTFYVAKQRQVTGRNYTYACRGKVCPAPTIIPPQGAILEGGKKLPSSVASGDSLSTFLTNDLGYECKGAAKALCMEEGDREV